MSRTPIAAFLPASRDSTPYLPVWEALLCATALAMRAIYVHGGLVGTHFVWSGLLAAVFLGLSRLTRARHGLGSSLMVGLTAWLQGASPVSALAWVAVGAALLYASRSLALPERLPRDQAWAETLRRSLLLVTALWVSQIFLSHDSVGAGDAVWYTTMLKDFVVQLQRGIFPVWTGQTEYAFNGSIFPLRIAPGFQHLGGALDWLTGHALTALQLKNLLIVLTFFAAGALMYECLLRISSRARNRAAMLGVLWLLSPGVLAPLYSGDQYMTFFTFPLLPLMILGWFRWQEAQHASAVLLLGLSLSGIWWCHTPVAIWATLFSGIALAAATTIKRRWRKDMPAYLALMGVGIVLGAYPVLSISVIDNKMLGTGNAAAVMKELRQNFAANHLPLNAQSYGLGSYQIGYSILALALVGLVGTFRDFRRLGIWAGVLLLMLSYCLPIPFVTAALWKALPESVIQVSNIWPQQRFFPLVTALVLFLFHTTRSSARLNGPRAWAVAGGAALLVIWSASQATHYFNRLNITRLVSAVAENSYAPENVLLTRYSYASFQTTPSYYSHGYVDPVFEHRLLHPQTEEVLVSNTEAAAPLPTEGQDVRLIASGRMTGHVDRAEKAFAYLPNLRLDPSAHYALRVRFPDSFSGTMTIAAPNLNRDYLLPDSGLGLPRPKATAAFGLTPTSTQVISLRTQAGVPIDLSFSLFLDEARRPPPIEYWLYRVDPTHLPIQVLSLAPYRAIVDFGADTLLETPRVWYRGWQASIDGVPTATQATQQNLVGIPLPAGKHEITLTYRPPLWLSALYWISCLSWPAALGMAHLRLKKTP